MHRFPISVFSSRKSTDLLNPIDAVRHLSVHIDTIPISSVPLEQRFLIHDICIPSGYAATVMSTAKSWKDQMLLLLSGQIYVAWMCWMSESLPKKCTSLKS